ncbi:MAG: hypothetical protein JKX69_10795 [Rhodobacteraceae bacterium]|nr:hypothetical protein [Paracoccaceae bacterium]
MTKKTLKSDGAAVSIYLDAPDWQGKPTAALGDFSCKTPEAGADILAQAIAQVQAAGLGQIIGPMSGDTWHSYRFVSQSDGSAPFLLEPNNKPHELAVFEDAGFAQISGYFSAKVPLEAAARNTPPETTDFTIEMWDGTDPERMFGQVFELSVQAFANNAFYKPISREDFLAMYMPIVPMIKKELIFFARRPDGSLAGFLFGIPNYADGPQPKAVILKTYASLSRGAGQHLAYAFHRAGLAQGFVTAIHALIHDDNLSAMRSAVEGAEIFRRYSLLGMQLDG